MLLLLKSRKCATTGTAKLGQFALVSQAVTAIWKTLYIILLLIVEIQAGPELSPWLSENNRKHENSAGEREETRALYDHSQEKVKRDSS